MKWRYILFLLILVSVSVCAQTDRQYIRMGNKQFRKGNYDKAEVEYSKALLKNKNNSLAVYNMACVLMHKEGTQSKDSLALEKFKEAAKMEDNKTRKAMAFHNIGWIFQSHEDYANAIEAYKEALRNNSKDNQTRYNLALCQRLLKKQGGGSNRNKDDKNQDKNNQDKQKQNQHKNKKDKQQQKQQPQQPKMSKENAEQLLNAAVQEEKKTQQRMQKALQQPQSKNLQKNW